MARSFLTRTDESLFGRWWWTIDRLFFGAISVLALIGLLLVVAASPSVANHLGLDHYYFVKRHMVMLVGAFALVFGVSLLPVPWIRRLGLLLFPMALAFLIMTFFMGMQIKGARRWLSLAGFSLQPSELLKPAFVIVSAWLFSRAASTNTLGLVRHKASLLCIGLFAFCAACLLLQPDLGQTILLTVVWVGQFFLAGLSWLWIGAAVGAGILGLGGAYLFLPHVTKRIDGFLGAGSKDPFGDGYQVTQSLEAFMRGGFFGQGPGEGLIKRHLPDAHADFIFAVAGEEFGLIFCLFLVALIGFIVFRSLHYALKSQDLFIVLAAFGLSLQFGLQALINIASTINLIPTKGMTLPFVSYGGSSTLAVGLALGALLGLLRRNQNALD